MKNRKVLYYKVSILTNKNKSCIIQAYKINKNKRLKGRKDRKNTEEIAGRVRTLLFFLQI